MQHLRTKYLAVLAFTTAYVIKMFINKKYYLHNSRTSCASLAASCSGNYGVVFHCHAYEYPWYYLVVQEDILDYILKSGSQPLPVIYTDSLLIVIVLFDALQLCQKIYQNNIMLKQKCDIVS
jgi:hypothetical protein